MQLSPMKIPKITTTISSLELMILYKKIKILGDSRNVITISNQYTFNVSEKYDVTTVEQITPIFRCVTCKDLRGNESIFIWIKGTDLTSVKDIMISRQNQECQVIEGCPAHKGYSKAADDITSHFKGVFKEKYFKEIIFLDTLVEGAIAAIAAALLRFNDHINAKAFTIGTPLCVCNALATRIRNENLKEKFIITVCNTDDIVASKGHTIGVNISNFFWILVKNAGISLIKSIGKISFETLTDTISGIY